MTTSVDTLAEHVRAYLDHLKVERGLSAHTIAAYSSDLDRYREYLGGLGITEPAQINQAVVAGFPVYLTGQGLAAASVGRMTVAVRGLHRFWAEEGRSADDPAHDVSPVSPGRRLPKALTLDQVTALIQATGGHLPGASPEQLCDLALVEVLYGTGARVSEILALTMEDVTRTLSDVTLGLRLWGKGGKERVVPLGSYARDALRAWLVRGRPQVAGLATTESPAVFLNSRGKPLSRQSAFNRIEALGTLAGIDQPVSPHTLRHTYATHLIDGGADIRVVQELLGHSSVATTQIYTLVTVDHLREVYASSHPRAHFPPDQRPL
ncbi:MAG: site-specific tyrosine recombinase XerD [Propionibacteriaceae bacterium]|nr:site-specific tyrosine recombinase XerD [Propionibacteriaceae bacterium]